MRWEGREGGYIKKLEIQKGKERPQKNRSILHETDLQKCCINLKDGHCSLSGVCILLYMDLSPYLLVRGWPRVQSVVGLNPTQGSSFSMSLSCVVYFLCPNLLQTHVSMRSHLSTRQVERGGAGRVGEEERGRKDLQTCFTDTHQHWKNRRTLQTYNAHTLGMSIFQCVLTSKTRRLLMYIRE